MKRAFDIIIALIALAIFLPIIFLACLAIKLYDGGPIFYTQTRIGKDGKEFKMWKLRSMKTNADALRASLIGEGVVRFKDVADPRITPPGKVIRKTSIDEMPQLFNVLVGDMSIVGPRPPIPEEVAKYNARHRRRLEVPQGITCYWQIMGRNELDFDTQVDLDIKYIEDKSFLTDLGILARTIPAVVSGRGAH